MQEGLRKISVQMYDSFSENVDFWLKTLYSEANETANEIWTNAKPYAEDFLKDIRCVIKKGNIIYFELNSMFFYFVIQWPGCDWRRY